MTNKQKNSRTLNSKFYDTADILKEVSEAKINTEDLKWPNIQEPKAGLFDSIDIEKEFFYDGYDENLIGDLEDQIWLKQLTEKEREMELFNRYERRESLKARFEARKRLRLKNETSQQATRDVHK
ncbi:hypothetical protein AVEN_242811-1 [Araneus ventricosus]|uniref:Uncharacterized protein n=1 Tax=Araneus ventricosus TaxID=182803 RepID=A0A4Y2QEI4_ARAVE|nr:hypothetical protein AVEN_242811-1 [Araneus ventricosus]